MRLVGKLSSAVALPPGRQIALTAKRPGRLAGIKGSSRTVICPSVAQLLICDWVTVSKVSLLAHCTDVRLVRPSRLLSSPYTKKYSSAPSASALVSRMRNCADPVATTGSGPASIRLKVMGSTGTSPNCPGPAALVIGSVSVMFSLPAPSLQASVMEAAPRLTVATHCPASVDTVRLSGQLEISGASLSMTVKATCRRLVRPHSSVTTMSTHFCMMVSSRIPHSNMG